VEGYGKRRENRGGYDGEGRKRKGRGGICPGS